MPQKDSALSAAQLEALLRLAARQMGTTPQALLDAAQSGQLAGSLSGNADPALQQALANPAAARKLLDSPQGRALLNQLLGGPGHG